MTADPSRVLAPTHQLCVVMPAHNEGERLREAVAEWVGELERLDLDYQIRVYDDGSGDDTRRVALDLASGNSRIAVFHHPNRGHGPTVLRGYREADADWVLQVDSDGELRASSFERLWRERASHDLLLGARTARSARPVRRLVSLGSQLAVRALFGRGVRDVNTPYRLMRGEHLRALLHQIPHDAFAPNVLLSGLAARQGLRVLEVPVEMRGGRRGLSGRALLRGVLRSIHEVVSTAVRTRRST